MSWLIGILAGLLLVAAGLGMPAAQISGFLVPGIDMARGQIVTEGAQLLRIFIVVDGMALLALAGYRFRHDAAAANAGYRPLWEPSRSAAAASDPAPMVTAGILLVALLLRVIALNSDLWIDEVLTVVNYIRLTPGEIITDFTDDNQHVLFSLLSHFSVSLFGESAWAIRMPAMLFGVASIWATMRIAALVYDRRVAVYSGLLLTVSYHHVWFSQNARAYTILLFGTVLSTWLLLLGLQHGKWRYWIGYALTIAFSAWAHLTAVFVAFAHALVILMLLLGGLRTDRSVWRPVAAILLAGWFTLHLYALVLPQLVDFFTRPGAGTGTAPGEWRSPLWLVNEIFHSLGIAGTLGWSGLTFMFLAGAACYYWFARRDWVFVALATLPGLLLGITMFLLGRNLWPRMFFNEAGFLVILLAVGLLALGGLAAQILLHRNSRLVSGLPAILLVLVFAASLPGIYRYPKQDFTGARDYVRMHAGSTDRVVGLHMAGRVYNQYYAEDWPEAGSLQELEQYRATDGYVWVLYTLPGYLENAHPELVRVLETDFDVVKVFPGTLGDGDVIVRRSKHKGKNS
jgi:mannosyltransferase